VIIFDIWDESLLNNLHLSGVIIPLDEVEETLTGGFLVF
jgi:hypothetical protein